MKIEGWYFSYDLGGFEDIFYLDSEADQSQLCFWEQNRGPYKTFAEAKKEALAWAKSDLLEAKLNLWKIRDFKKSDASGQETPS